jgi:hypothetical protein
MRNELVAGSILGLFTVAAFACGSNGSSPPASDAGIGADAPADTSIGTHDAGPPPSSEADSASETAPAEAAAKAPAAPFDWVGVIGTGQSLSTGCIGAPSSPVVVSVTQPYHNLKLLDQGPDPKYPIDGSATAVWSAIPLVEPIRQALAGSGPGYGDNQYPENICDNDGAYGETPHSGMANALSAIWAARGETGDYVTAHTVVGKGGACLNQIDATGGGLSFPAALSEVRVFESLATAAGKTYGVGGIILTHGECDAATANVTYGSGVYALQQAYDSAIKAITGQTRDVVLLASQQSSFNDGYDGTAVQIWEAMREHPGQIVVTGPKYAFAPYGVHLPAFGYERVGEKYGEVFDAIVNQGVAWNPVGPNNVTRTGAVITVDFDVPNPPLVWDTHLAPPHQQMHTAWANGNGFEVKDGTGNEVTIASVAIQASSVVITLAAAPAPGTTLTLGYAVTQDSDPGMNLGGYGAGLHGLLRDSDTFSGASVEAIAVQATQASPMLTAAAGAFVRRGSSDLVTGGGLPADTIVSSVISQASGDQMTLSTPWTGPTGAAMLTFQHDNYNYCVHFAMPVP